jgi:hypothetical protein
VDRAVEPFPRTCDHLDILHPDAQVHPGAFPQSRPNGRAPGSLLRGSMLGTIVGWRIAVTSSWTSPRLSTRIRACSHQFDPAHERGADPPDAKKRSGARPGWNGGLYAFMRLVSATDAGGELYAKRVTMIEPSSPTTGERAEQRGLARLSVETLTGLEPRARGARALRRWERVQEAGKHRAGPYRGAAGSDSGGGGLRLGQDPAPSAG